MSSPTLNEKGLSPSAWPQALNLMYMCGWWTQQEKPCFISWKTICMLYKRALLPHADTFRACDSETSKLDHLGRCTATAESVNYKLIETSSRHSLIVISKLVVATLNHKMCCFLLDANMIKHGSLFFASG